MSSFRGEHYTTVALTHSPQPIELSRFVPKRLRHLLLKLSLGLCYKAINSARSLEANPVWVRPTPCRNDTGLLGVCIENRKAFW